ncbi:hypothetical protein BKA69DRAFT_527168 [Paraphysoderma sedebokerense]|nr:hypothetical protein BKA69DRAFT_527168 [Paraphysoderma sedebokerense]
MDSLAFVQNQTLSLSATQINFDPVIRNFDSTGASVYFQRLFNDSSRYVISALSSQVELLQSVTLPYIVDFPNIPSYDCRIDSDGNILAAFTSIMNSSIGLGSTEILVSTINSTSGALSSTVVVSTIRQDNVSRIYLPSTSSVIVTGTTDGNLSAPSSQLTGRRFFLARFQRISVNTIETSTSGRIAKGETFKISFTSLPSAARTSGLPTVMLQSRPCTSVIWINATTISGVAPTAIGKSVELFVSYYYLPQTPSVVDFRLSYPDPVITEVTPSQGPAIGFDITITVNHLGIPGNDTVNVMIGNSPCNNITQIASDKITCRVPFGTGVLHRLIVSTEPAAKSTENVFISYDPPRLNAVSPSVGATAGNTIVRLSGQNFGQCPQTPPCSSNISVTIGGKSCSSVLLLNDTNVECRSPANIGKNHSVIIDVGGITAQNVSALFSYEKPAISSLVPSTASTSNPTIYVEGSNFGIFENIPTVQLISENGTYECPSVTWKSDSSIKW